MDQEKAEEFIQRLMEDPSLRVEFARDAKGTAESAGITLSDDDVKALQSVDWADEEMVARVSKRMQSCRSSDVNLKENIVPISWD